MTFKSVNLGRISYGDAMAVQEEWHRRVVQGESPGVILLVEHDPVITLGEHDKSQHLLKPIDFFERHGIEVVQSDRGGQTTAHMPGQLVVYPVVPVARIGVRRYVSALERAVINVLEDFAICGQTDREFPGVWVENRKICAIGVRVRQRVATHGLALNVDPDLSIFDHFVPCGISGRAVTSMAAELPQAPEMTEVADQLLAGLGEEISC